MTRLAALYIYLRWEVLKDLLDREKPTFASSMLSIYNYRLDTRNPMSLGAYWRHRSIDEIERTAAVIQGYEIEAALV